MPGSLRQVFFILITSNKDMILPTILSRCMKIYFAPLSYLDVAKVLQQKIHSLNFATPV